MGGVIMGALKPIIITLCTVLISSKTLFARDQIRVSGSSTVLPYARIVAENFSEFFTDFKTPLIESGGSGPGIKEFCRGVGEDKIDIANASRKRKKGEFEECKKNGVSDIEEVRIGYDGVVLAVDNSLGSISMKIEDLYKALAAKIIVKGQLISNPLKKWSEINPSMPNIPISIYIPGEKHGTREGFEEKVLKEGCEVSGALEEIKRIVLDKEEANKTCLMIRKDGVAIDIDGDYTETLTRINANKTAFGVFGFSFYKNNADILKVVAVNGITPSMETIASSQYPIARPLFFYLKKAHLSLIPGLKEYVDYFVSDQMIGPESPLVKYGLVPMPDSERKIMQNHVKVGEIMNGF
ncbi:Phosphate ABC transporter, periplasmic phosphate-binding protein PstS [Liberibacter crescens BT-1]|uniref:Phosphate ABC transporter, periplasmic phosphate-binding protein PstS n=2 Tax=Liberibacter crescens TaxID=1273132 RepID=L0EXZ6_LIBCB|nr:Phosphate ABC transporter, periplasmic phosphate-binding protein PstS [Liberibacter crescens BT-1]